MASDTDKLDIPALRAVLEKMTPAPWRKLGESIVNTAHITRDIWTIPRTTGDLPGICALRNAAPQLFDRVAELEAEAAKTDELLAATVAKWEEMERCAYNICAHCKEPFERGDAMSLHAQECSRNPVVMLNRAQAERIRALEGALAEALLYWPRTMHADPRLVAARTLLGSPQEGG